MPAECRTGVLVQVHKKWDRADVVNYPGVTLTLVASKVLEKVVVARLRADRERRCR